MSRISFLVLIKRTYAGWRQDNSALWCAALAYFTVFSIGPLLLIIISLTGLLLNQTSVELAVIGQIRGLIGNGGAGLLEVVIQHARKPSAGVVGSVIGIITLLLGALGVFNVLQQMFNHIWGVKPKPKNNLWLFILDRLLNFSVVGVIAFLLLVSLLASTLIAGIGSYLNRYLPVSPFLLESLNFIFSFAVITVLFAFIMKVLPDIEVSFRHIWFGAVITSLLFTVGKTLIGLYIGHSGLSSEYGAAASLVILLLWTYYSAQIIFLGAEFTKTYFLMQGNRITPNRHAETVRN